MSILFSIVRRQVISSQQRIFFSVSSALNMDVKHDPENMKFYIPLEKGEGVLEYSIENKDVMNMYHTGVPTANRGQGIAKYLVQGALDYAVENSMKIKPTCSYVLKYVNDHPNPSYKIVE